MPDFLFIDEPAIPNDIPMRQDSDGVWVQDVQDEYFWTTLRVWSWAVPIVRDRRDYGVVTTNGN